MSCDITISDLGKTQAPEHWVHEVLEPDQLTTAKIRYGRKKLGRGTLALLWALRVYVVFMIFIIGLVVWKALHAGG
jgi:hypothetical protein